MSTEELSKKRSRDQDEDDVLKIEKKKKKDKKEKKEKKDKKDKSEKKDKKDKKDKSEKKEKKEKETKSEEPAPSSTASPTQAQVDDFLKTNFIAIEDPDHDSTKPILSFDQMNIDKRILKVLSQFPTPTPIQSASWPYLVNGRDIVGVAETGSGKTFAFAVPALNHLISHSPNKRGVRVLVVSPTRELAMQIHESIKSLTDVVNLEAVCVYGGVPKDAQRKALKSSSIVIATLVV